MKRVFALLLVLAMVFSLGVTAFAAGETGSITVTNATYGETYKAYKIFDASIKYKTNADGTVATENGKPVVEGVAYSIETTSQFFSKLFQKVTADDGTVTYVNTTGNTFFDYNPDTGSVTKKDGVNDSELIKYLTKLVTEGSFEPEGKSILAVEDGKDQDDYTLKYTFDPAKYTTDVGPEIAFQNLPYGYYLITSTLGTTVTINSSTPDVSVIDKNQKPGTDFNKQVWDDVQNKWVDSNSANIGDKITYKISFTGTNYDGDRKIEYYRVHDQKGDAIWAEFNSIQVFVDGVELPRGYYLSQGGDADNGTWLWLGDYDNTCPTENWASIPEANRDRDDAQWYLVHLGYDEFRITIPWLENHELKDVTNDQGEVTSYALSYDGDQASKYGSPSEIVITYDSVIEPGAAIGGTTHGNRFNKANASWTSGGYTGSTPPDEVVTQVYGIGLQKIDGASKQNLAGAKFRIYKDKDCTQPVYVIPTDIDGVYMVDSMNTYAVNVTGSKMLDSRELYTAKVAGYDAILTEYLKDDKGNAVEQNNLVVSQINGKLIVLGLEAGSYFLKEVEAPDGYNALTTPVELVAGVDSSDFNIFYNPTTGDVANIQQPDGVHTEKTYDVTHTMVSNSKGVELPSTGGEGAFMMITIGTMIAMAFAVLMITQKKMSVYKD